jgi:hypothetical protein
MPNLVKFTQSALEIAPLKKDKKVREYAVFVNADEVTHVDDGSIAQSHENDTVKTRIHVTGGSVVLVDDSVTDVVRKLAGKAAAAAAD